MKKKLISILLVVAMIITSTSAVFAAEYAPEEISVYENYDIAIYVDGKLVELDTPVIIENGYSLVQIRPILEALGFYIEWDAKSKIALMAERLYNGTSLCTAIKINDNVAKQFHMDDYMNMLESEPYDIKMGTPARIINGTTMIPVRFVGELTGRAVHWDAEYKVIDIRPHLIDERGNIVPVTEYNYRDYSVDGIRYDQMDNTIYDDYTISDEQKAINDQYIIYFDEPVDSYPGAFQ